MPTIIKGSTMTVRYGNKMDELKMSTHNKAKRSDI